LDEEQISENRVAITLQGLIRAYLMINSSLYILHNIFITLSSGCIARGELRDGCTTKTNSNLQQQGNQRTE